MEDSKDVEHPNMPAESAFAKTTSSAPSDIPPLHKTMKGVNTFIAEQSFAWFDGYAHTFNSIGPLRKGGGSMFGHLGAGALHGDAP